MNYSLMLSVMIALAGFTIVSSQLPCDSVLRRLPTYAYLFTHCDCLYSDWTDWVAINRMAVDVSQCPSRSALIYERKQLVISGECDDIEENSTICEPEMIDRLILALGIGSSGQDITPGPPGLPGRPGCSGRKRSLPPSNIPGPVGPTIATEDPGLCPTLPPQIFKRQDQICHHVTVPHGRRSVEDQMEKPQVDREITEPERLPNDPLPFNIAEHGARYRRQDYCAVQHILFVLDTSGSIGENDFNTVTRVLGMLVPLFCKPIKIAAMTFDHEYYVEFCFNDYDNTGGGRQGAGEAIGNIPYIRPGQGSETRWTHTAGAAQCVCDYVFRDRGCGIDGNDGIDTPAAPCVDVVFFTDGHANDPVENICETVQCLHGIRNVNTYTISVGDPNTLKLDCMEENDLKFDEYHLFNFQNISVLEDQLNLIISRLISDPFSYECASTFIDPQG